jgi:hypothetical protein
MHYLRGNYYCFKNYLLHDQFADGGAPRFAFAAGDNNAFYRSYSVFLLLTAIGP